MSANWFQFTMYLMKLSPLINVGDYIGLNINSIKQIVDTSADWHAPAQWSANINSRAYQATRNAGFDVAEIKLTFDQSKSYNTVSVIIFEKQENFHKQE